MATQLALILTLRKLNVRGDSINLKPLAYFESTVSPRRSICQARLWLWQIGSLDRQANKDKIWSHLELNIKNYQLQGTDNYFARCIYVNIFGALRAIIGVI
jgi:hypothetical protein